jgi:hypothetical protein
MEANHTYLMENFRLWFFGKLVMVAERVQQVCVDDGRAPLRDGGLASVL